MARLWAAALFVTVGWAAAIGTRIARPPAAATQHPTDLGLYSKISSRVATGEAYYPAVVAEQYAQGYPVQPAPTVRLPTTTYVNAALGERGAHLVLIALGVCVVALAIIRLETVCRSRLEWFGSTALLIAALVVTLAPGGQLFAETWASLLLVAAALVGPRRRPWTALALVLAAATFRELALLFVPGIVWLLWHARQRGAAAVWLFAAGAVAVLYLGLHPALVSEAVVDVGNSRTSGGWLRFGGWPLVVDYTRRITVLDVAPYAVSAVLAPLAVLGLALRRSAVTTAMLAGAVGFLIAFMVIGRTNNAYWGLLYAPLLLPGLAFAPSAIREVAVAALKRRATT